MRSAAAARCLTSVWIPQSFATENMLAIGPIYCSHHLPFTRPRGTLTASRSHFPGHMEE